MNPIGRFLRPRAMNRTLGALAARVGGVVFFLAVAVICALVLWAFPRQDRLAAERDARVLQTSATIRSTELIHKRGRDRAFSHWELEAWYRYDVEGKTWVGNKFHFHGGALRFPTEAEARAARAAWADGSTVTVWYDPAEPGNSALIRDWKPVSSLVPWAAGIGLLGLATAWVMAVATWRQLRRAPLPDAVITRAIGRLKNLGAVVAGSAAVLLAAHAAPMVWHDWFVKPRLAQAVPVFHWELDVHHGPPTPVSKYVFRPEGRTDWVEGRDWRFGRTGLATMDDAEAVKERLQAAHREGRLRVAYLPSDPSRCALSPEHGGTFPRSVWLSAAVLFALAAPLAGLCHRARRRRQAR